MNKHDEILLQIYKSKDIKLILYIALFDFIFLSISLINVMFFNSKAYLACFLGILLILAINLLITFRENIYLLNLIVEKEHKIFENVYEIFSVALVSIKIAIYFCIILQMLVKVL
ncbi:MAG: hypothetical protein WBA74_07160 [Cyclobacteriaceae bacterium]